MINQTQKYEYVSSNKYASDIAQSEPNSKVQVQFLKFRISTNPDSKKWYMLADEAWLTTLRPFEK